VKTLHEIEEAIERLPISPSSFNRSTDNFAGRAQNE
jgi:hypothetical protein